MLSIGATVVLRCGVVLFQSLVICATRYWFVLAVEPATAFLTVLCKSFVGLGSMSAVNRVQVDSVVDFCLCVFGPLSMTVIHASRHQC